MNKFTVRIGFLGGGQLARMLALAAHNLGAEAHVLSPSAEDPAAQVTRYWRRGSVDCLEDVEAIAQRVDYLCFESEFVAPAILQRLRELKSDITIQPDPSLMLELQDRLNQKKAMEKFSLPTSPFFAFSSFEELQKKSKQMGPNPRPMVLKTRRNGYDGYGTYILKDEADQGVLDFIGEKASEVGCIAEAFVPFERELALSFVRNARGDFCSFPLVETHQEDNRCLWVKGPVTHPALDSFKEKAKTFMEAIGYVGIMAFELFDVKGELVVNEIAPRVHNSAHYSLNSFSESQFDMHLKALMNWPLKTPLALSRGFAMYNLLGSGLAEAHFNPERVGANSQLHWYGKMENRLGRKMGHLNAQADSADGALSKLKAAREEYAI